MAEEFTIRPAEAKDLPQIHSILSYYILNTVTTFRTELTTLDDGRETLETCRSHGLPYLVLVSSPSSTSRPSQEDASDHEDVVHAYCYVKAFRGSKGGYLHTAELTILTRHEDVGRGFGSKILPATISELKRDGKIKQLLAVMAIEKDERRAERLKAFYASLGFVEKGRLSKVGWKFGEWIDTRYMQLEL